MYIKLTKVYKVKSHYYILNQLSFQKELKAHQVRTTTKPAAFRLSKWNYLSLITTFSSYASSPWRDHFDPWFGVQVVSDFLHLSFSAQLFPSPSTALSQEHTKVLALPRMHPALPSPSLSAHVAPLFPSCHGKFPYIL